MADRGKGGLGLPPTAWDKRRASGVEAKEANEFSQVCTLDELFQVVI